MKDELGDRMKLNYENRTKIWLPRRTYTIIRIDGKAFHTYTKGLNKPFDMGMIEDMDETAKYLCKYIQGAKIGFVQSDEISILLTDFDKIGTDAWFDGNIQKIVSVAASKATAKFNQLRLSRECVKYGNVLTPDVIDSIKLAEFDARTFTIPARYEVQNYFVWRQQDTIRNSISSVAQDLYSSKELEGKNAKIQKEMISSRSGIGWDDYIGKLKQGRFIHKETHVLETEYKGIEFQQVNYERTRWVSSECPVFTQAPEFLTEFIPEM